MRVSWFVFSCESSFSVFSLDGCLRVILVSVKHVLNWSKCRKMVIAGTGPCPTINLVPKRIHRSSHLSIQFQLIDCLDQP